MGSKVISAILTLKDQNFGSGLRRAGGQLNDFDRHLLSTANTVGRFAKSAVSGFKTVAGAAAALGTTALVGLGASVANSVLEMDESFAMLKARTTATGDDLKNLEQAAINTFKRGYGESLDEVASAVANVTQNIHKIKGDEIEQVTANALLLSKVLDEDVNEGTRSVQALMENFGTTATDAFDLLIEGNKRGLNMSNELLDNVTEFSAHYVDAGYTVEEMFGIMERGAKAGVYNMSYVSDAVKEFQLLSTDGSKSTKEAMGSLSKETQKVWKAQYEGKATVADVASSVIKDLESMENKTEANGIAVSLFGTKFEDLRANGIYAMLGVRDEMENFKGSTDEAGQAIEGTFKNRIVSSVRSVASELAKVVSDGDGKKLMDDIATAAENLAPKIVEVGTKAVELGQTIVDNWKPIIDVTLAAITTFTVFRGSMIALGVIGTIVSLVKAYRVAVVGATVSQAIFNGVLFANPLGLVIAAIALLAGGLVLLWKNIDKVKAVWDSFWTGAKKVAASAVNAVIEEINRLISSINNIPFVNIPEIGKVSWGSDNTYAGGSAQALEEMVSGSYAVGSNNIQNDHIAQVHKGEMIIPESKSEILRANGVNIANIDSLLAKRNAGGGNIPGNPAPQSNAGGSNGGVVIENANVTVQVSGAGDAEEVANKVVKKINEVILNIA